MRILVTGRQGQLARALAERAASRADLELITAGRPDADLAIPGSVADAVRSVRPDLVVNAAAFTEVDRAEDEPELAFRINAESAGEAAAAAAEYGAMIIQISTDFVFDGCSNAPYREESPPKPLGVYGRSKLAGEQAVAAANPRHCILRTAWLYSPFARNFVKTMVAAAHERDQLSVVDDQRGSPTSALDLADGILTLIDGTVWFGKTYHLAGSGSASWFDLAAHVMEKCHALGLPSAEIRPIATVDWPTKAVRPSYSVLDSGKFAHDFHFLMPDWRDSVDAAVARLAKVGAEG